MSKKPQKDHPMINAEIADQLPALVVPLQAMIGRGVAEKGFHPVALSHAMMLAGMLELIETAGRDFTLEILHDMVSAVEDAEGIQEALQ